MEKCWPGAAKVRLRTTWGVRVVRSARSACSTSCAPSICSHLDLTNRLILSFCYLTPHWLTQNPSPIRPEWAPLAIQPGRAMPVGSPDLTRRGARLFLSSLPSALARPTPQDLTGLKAR